MKIVIGTSKLNRGVMWKQKTVGGAFELAANPQGVEESRQHRKISYDNAVVAAAEGHCIMLDMDNLYVIEFPGKDRMCVMAVDERHAFNRASSVLLDGIQRTRDNPKKEEEFKKLWRMHNEIGLSQTKARLKKGGAWVL